MLLLSKKACVVKYCCSQSSANVGIDRKQRGTASLALFKVKTYAPLKNINVDGVSYVFNLCIQSVFFIFFF